MATSWDEQKTKLKKLFPGITEEDLFFTLGRKPEMFEKLQIKLGKTKEEFSKIIEAL
jgi:hypothetical protein